VVAEFRDSDSEGASPLCAFYKKPGPPGTGVFSTKGFAAVLHHQEKPEFYEEVCNFCSLCIFAPTFLTAKNVCFRTLTFADIFLGR